MWLLLFSVGAYSWLILRRWHAWQRMDSSYAPESFQPATAITVIIPVRNEAQHIGALLQDLEAQQYPQHLLEVLLVDDHSEDATTAVAAEFILATTIDVKIIRLDSYVNLVGKKAAVRKGVELATGELLVFTDGDCRIGPEWLRQFAFLYQTRQPYFISGPVCFQHTNTLFERMQLVEFASLIGVGGASLQLQKPNMCNGANLAYTKTIFEEVGGFAGNEAIASGDDEFLLHKISKCYPDKVAFLKSQKAIVYTMAPKSLPAFILQRVRWASKWKSYQNRQVQAVAVVVFAANLFLFLAIPAAGLGLLHWQAFLPAYAVKCAIDFLFLNRILSFLRKQRYLVYMLPLQFVYIPYVVCIALAGLFGRYHWKGRMIRNL